jgi:pSer/pThr/pTyr-binding forkhead associated (FHA) protein
LKQESQNSELTRTLHLGVRSVVDASPESAIDALLASMDSQSSQAIQAIIDGNGDRSMVVIHRGPSKGARFLIAESNCSIGRSPESAIFLDDVTVSRAHAQISKNSEGFELLDLGSLNGTYVNNGSVKSVQLKTGDEIQVGKFHLIFIQAKPKN